MSAILGVFNCGNRTSSDPVIGRMLGAMHARGADQANICAEHGNILATSRFAWELEEGFAGPVLTLREDELIIAADASLYYRDDLRRRLASEGVRPSGSTPSHYILAAYRAWGEKCPEHLEGDFAFVLYDAGRRRVIAARDFVGSRPLFFREAPGGGLVIASSIGAIGADPECPRDLDLSELAIDAAGLVFSVGERTCVAGILRLTAGSTLTRASRGRVRVSKHWSPPVYESPSTTDFEEGARELRAVLTEAVAQRMDSARPSVVWMSGGRDSTAIFAAGRHAVACGFARGPLGIASARLPNDDPFCETEKIEAVAAHCGVTPRWLEMESIPLVPDPVSSARARDEPWTQDYEQFLRALTVSTRALGGRVAFNGHGGDLLFYSSRVVLADLLARGRILALRREWKAQGDRGYRAFFKWAVQPLLSPRMLRVTAALRGGRRLHGVNELTVPPWIDREFVRANDLEARVASAVPDLGRHRRDLAEMGWLMQQPHFHRVMASLSNYGLDAGVETRMPLMDNRVVTFALSRPVCERRSGGDTKLLLRAAMRGLLPDSVLQRRRFKTGALGEYFRRGFTALIAHLQEIARDPVLADLGIVDRAELRRVVERATRTTPDIRIGPDLVSTLQAEYWVRARIAGREPLETSMPRETIMSA